MLNWRRQSIVPSLQKAGTSDVGNDAQSSTQAHGLWRTVFVPWLPLNRNDDPWTVGISGEAGRSSTRSFQKEQDSSRAPYDHTKFVESRKVIMQDWADILDSLQAGKPVEGVTKAFGPMSKRRTALLRVIERE